MHFIEGNRQQLFQLLPPIGALAGLRGLLVAAVDEVQFGLLEDHFRHHGLVVDQRVPTDRQVDNRASSSGTAAALVLTIRRPLIR